MKPKATPARPLRAVLVGALTLAVAVACDTEPRQESAPSGPDRDAPTETVPLAPELAGFQALLGSWMAQGEGFATRIRYRAGVTGALVYAENELLDSEGVVTQRYEGVYRWDPVEEDLRFDTVAETGEHHVGRAEWDGGLWHYALVFGGSIDRYTSQMTVVSADRLEYRAIYGADGSTDDVRAAEPLTYERLPGR